MIKRNYEKYFRHYLSKMIRSEIEGLKDIVRNTDLKDDKYFNKLFMLPEIVNLILKLETGILNDINVDSEYNQKALKALNDQEIESKAMALIKAALTIWEFKFTLNNSFVELKNALESFYEKLMYEGIFLFFLVNEVDERLPELRKLHKWAKK